MGGCFPQTLYLYGFPHPVTGKQNVEIHKFSDFRKIDDVTMPYHIDIEAPQEDGETVTMKMTVVAWTLHEKMDPEWFSPPASN